MHSAAPPAPTSQDEPRLASKDEGAGDSEPESPPLLQRRTARTAPPATRCTLPRPRPREARSVMVMETLKIEIGELLGWRRGRSNLPGCGALRERAGGALPAAARCLHCTAPARPSPSVPLLQEASS